MCIRDRYNNADNDYTGSVTQFNNDIITGNIPDIILLDSSLPIESYFQKDVYKRQRLTWTAVVFSYILSKGCVSNAH